jgi:hypothetical protein
MVAILCRRSGERSETQRADGARAANFLPAL